MGKAKFGGSGAGMVVVGLRVGVSFSCCGSHLGELCPSGVLLALAAVGGGGGDLTALSLKLTLFLFCFVINPLQGVFVH